MPAVKANAYGHGIVEVSKHLESIKTDYLAVAFISEGVTLRKNGIKTPILVLSAIDDIENAIRYNLTLTVYSEKLIPLIEKTCKLMKKRIKIHLDVDTGMGRIGLQPDRVLPAVKKILLSEHLIFEGIYTHFASSEDLKDPYTERQLLLFNRILQQLKYLRLTPPLIHTANSGAILNYPLSFFNMVRPGIMLYGYPPCKTELKLDPVLSLHSCIFFLKKINLRTGIGYGHTYTAKPGELIATIPIGYGDGYNRLLSGKGKVIIKGKFAPIAGRISMDQITVNVTKIPNVKEKDPVTLIGTEGKIKITAEDIAKSIGTIPYEVLCNLNSRITRIYE